MVFALERRTIGKKVKQIPVIRYKNGEYKETGGLRMQAVL